ncbi:MAG: STAS domain-containing protein [Ignavibacteriaceae bacterium]
MDNFSTIVKGDVIIEVVNLIKATREQAEEFKLILLKHIEDDDIKLIVDIHQCDYIDSTFLSSLLIALKATKKKGGNLKIASPKHDVLEMLEATGMNRVFDIYSNISDTIKSYNNE